jgi:hypothetical protein
MTTLPLRVYDLCVQPYPSDERAITNLYTARLHTVSSSHCNGIEQGLQSHTMAESLA